MPGRYRSPGEKRSYRGGSRAAAARFRVSPACGAPEREGGLAGNVPRIPSSECGVAHAMSSGRDPRDWHSPPFQVVNIGDEGLPKAGE